MSFGVEGSLSSSSKVSRGIKGSSNGLTKNVCLPLWSSHVLHLIEKVLQVLDRRKKGLRVFKKVLKGIRNSWDSSNFLASPITF